MNINFFSLYVMHEKVSFSLLAKSKKIIKALLFKTICEITIIDSRNFFYFIVNKTKKILFFLYFA